MRVSISAAAFVIILSSSALPAMAESRQTLGFGRLFSNDLIGDGDDRWRSGSYSFSVVRGYPWMGTRPPRLGDIIEYRTRSEILSPAPNTGSPGDRLYVGALTFGLHSHAAMGGVDISIGARSSTLEAQFLLLNRVRP
jgi:hypothetical protein